jgi:hypothetical protein
MLAIDKGEVGSIVGGYLRGAKRFALYVLAMVAVFMLFSRGFEYAKPIPPVDKDAIVLQALYDHIGKYESVGIFCLDYAPDTCAVIEDKDMDYGWDDVNVAVVVNGVTYAFDDGDVLVAGAQVLHIDDLKSTSGDVFAILYVISALVLTVMTLCLFEYIRDLAVLDDKRLPPPSRLGSDRVRLLLTAVMMGLFYGALWMNNLLAPEDDMAVLDWFAHSRGMSLVGIVFCYAILICFINAMLDDMRQLINKKLDIEAEEKKQAEAAKTKAIKDKKAADTKALEDKNSTETTNT